MVGKIFRFLCVMVAIGLVAGFVLHYASFVRGGPSGEKEEEALSALSEKYGRKFEAVRVYPKKVGESWREMTVRPADEPEMVFTLSFDMEGDHISDNYVERLICRQIGRQAAGHMDGLSCSYYLFARAMGPQPLTDDAGISIRSYAELDPLNKFRIELFVASGTVSADDLYDGLSGMFEGLEYLDAEVRLFVVDGEGLQAVREFFQEEDDVTMDFQALSEDFYSLHVGYEDGRIAMDRSSFADRMEHVIG